MNAASREDSKASGSDASDEGSKEQEAYRKALDTLIRFLPPAFREDPGKLKRALLAHGAMNRPGFAADLEASYLSLCNDQTLSPQAAGEYVRGEVQQALRVVATLWEVGPKG
jgi:hypothetical protein